MQRPAKRPRRPSAARRSMSGKKRKPHWKSPRRQRWYDKRQADPKRRAAYNATMADRMQRRRDLAKRTPPKELRHEGLAIVGDVRPPRLLYIDRAGHVHIEDNLSAEELIRRYEDTHKKGGGSPT